MAAKKKAGRPRKTLTEDEKVQLEALAAALNSEQIADFFGIGRSTFYDMMERDEDISGRYKRGRAKAIAGVAGNLITQARNGNTSAAIFYLKTQAGWKEQTQEESTDAQPMTFHFSVNQAVDEIKVTNAT